MIKFVVFLGRTEHSRHMFRDIYEWEEAVTEKQINKKIVKFINILHTSCRSNQYFRIPLQNIWYPFYLQYDKLPRDRKLLFLFCEENRLCYDKKYLKYLRKRYPKARIGFYAINSSYTIGEKYLELINLQYDFVVTFDKQDSERYGWIYYSGVYSSIPHEDYPIIYDLLFVGNNAGRINLLHEIYAKLKSKGIKCKFIINQVPSSDMIKNSDIEYNRHLSYDEIIKLDLQSKCILEVLRENQHGNTLRLSESIVLGRKLLTNNSNILQERYYNENMMQVFDKIEDINVDFLTSDIPKNIRNRNVLSPINMLNQLDQIV